jgi:predicted transcriptional regulator YdeE
VTDYRIVERPAFEVIGKKTWISGPGNAQFGRSWQACQSEGLLDTLWLPASGFVHANAPEMEVYPPESRDDSDGSYCEFRLPIVEKR